MREVMKETDRDGNQWLTKENVKGIIYDLYAAGIGSCFTRAFEVSKQGLGRQDGEKVNQ